MNSRIMLSLLVCLVTAVVFSAGDMPAVKRKLTPEERRAKIEAHRAMRLAEAGGLVSKPNTGSTFRILNASKHIPESVLKKTLSTFNLYLKIPVAIETGESVENVTKAALALLKKPKTGAVLLLVDDKEAPSLLVAPEQAWASVNIARLADDLPPDEIFALRVQKEIWRASSFVLGGSNAQNQPCLMTDIHSLSDLDQNKLDAVSPEALMKIERSLPSLGIQATRTTTYKNAILEGWAPAPTNDVQRALWTQIKAEKERGPSNPLKIEPTKK